MPEVDDWELVARAQTGDTEAFADLVRRYQGPVIHFCARMVGTLEDAEDVAQQCFMRLHRHLPRLAPRARFSTAVFGIARNLALNHVRDRKRRGRDRAETIEGRHIAAPPQAAADRGARRAEIAGVLEAALAELSPEHREVLILREFEEMDYDSIAKVLRCRKGTVRSRLSRARDQLRERLLAAGGDLL